MTLLTIGIACFNAEDTIERSITAALNQTWEDKEIIIVDDRSQDNSVNIIKEIAKNDPRIRLFQREINSGFASNLNLMIKEAAGKYILIQDDDDESLPDRAKKQVEALKNAENMLGHDYIICNASRNVIGKNGEIGFSKAIGTGHIPVSGESLALHMFFRDILDAENDGAVATGSLLAKVETLKRLGGYDPQFRREEDSDLVVRLALSGGACIGIAEPLLRQHRTVSPDKAGKIPLNNMLLLVKKHKSYLSRRLYYAATMKAYSRHYYTIRDKLRARIYLFALILLRPSSVNKAFRSTVRRRARYISNLFYGDTK
ncbi:glycosyltransferase family 2 protein [Devosia honganensis]|uniref:Glycosyltransferase family 2 protein n=1 Tax=Devosia honganensis TaxID=1610527 RepID=A0ABV7WX97_9HYPH